MRNLLAAMAAAHAVGPSLGPRCRRGVRTFRSVRRRMEVRGEIRGVTVIDDFAHHPTAVRETVRATRQRYPGRRMIAIFEPRSYTAQRREFQAHYEAALADADGVILAGLFHPERYAQDSALDLEGMVRAWRDAGLEAETIADPAEIARQVTARSRRGDVVLVMSNGGFGGLHGKLLAGLTERFGAA